MASSSRVLSPVENIISLPRTPPKVLIESAKPSEKLGSPEQFNSLTTAQDSKSPSSKASETLRKRIDNQGLSKFLSTSPNVGALSSGVQVVKLQVDSVTDEVAARLAISLLGHVLFLKNQIPLPVPQLSRLSSSKSTSSRGAKQRAELLASFDTLTSHLTSTFAALSLALYKSCSPEKLAKLATEDGSILDCAYLAVVLGPSLGTAKSRTFLAVDGFEARLREAVEGSNENDVPKERIGRKDLLAELDAEEGSESEFEDESSAEEPLPSEDEDTPSDSESDEELPLPPPPPRISFVYRDPPTPQTPSTKPRVISPHTSPLKPREPLRPSPIKPRKSLPLSPFNPRRIPAPSFQPSFAEEQRFLQNTERLLSRVLAAADAEGYGFANEMAPTQTHVLLRAPRHFSHPSWIPRQNITASMESSLEDFLAKSRSPQREPEPTNPKKGPLGRKKQQASEGVWVTGKKGSEVPESLAPQTEDEEMIWWSWDGRIAGFSECSKGAWRSSDPRAIALVFGRSWQAIAGLNRYSPSTVFCRGSRLVSGAPGDYECVSPVCDKQGDTAWIRFQMPQMGFFLLCLMMSARIRSMVVYTHFPPIDIDQVSLLSVYKRRGGRPRTEAALTFLFPQPTNSLLYSFSSLSAAILTLHSLLNYQNALYPGPSTTFAHHLLLSHHCPLSSVNTASCSPGNQPYSVKTHSDLTLPCLLRPSPHPLLNSPHSTMPTTPVNLNTCGATCSAASHCTCSRAGPSRLARTAA
ncbi:hypothetical protein NMY22_g6244 [Coprinellus aureogranulatus]|nr:hypothetical protein NMY22_g6244 [Coprinellus aureogranulatus]